MSILGATVILATAALLTVLIGVVLIKPLRRWEWVHQKKLVRVLGIMGFLGGLVALTLIFRVGDTFGFPGSIDYQIYERFNRSMAFILAFQTCAIFAFVSANFRKLNPFSQSVAAVMLGGWFSMVIGTAAEFWLFSGLPYAEINMRSFSFSLFSMGSLLAGLSMLILGIRILIRRTVAWFFGVILVLYLPVDAALFIRGDSIFLTPAVVAVGIGIITLVHNRNPDLANSKPA